MSPGNSSDALAFLLVGIPGLADLHRWVFIPFCLMYLIAVLGNCTILLVVRTYQRLHEPMYYFLSMLATTDLGLTLSTLPTVPHVFWFNTMEISFPVCLTQMFCIHAFSFMESSVLLAMAFDRYMAICYPLRYSSILTPTRIAKVGLGIICRCTLTLFPLICLLTRLSFCRSHVLTHSYCLHQDMIRLACTDTTLNSLYGLTLVLLIVILDPVLITVSYIMIIKTVLGIASREEQAKALNTCISHFSAVLIFYVPMVGLSIIHRYGKNAAPISHVLMANIYLFVPPVLNPIIQSMQTKHIRKGIVELLCQRLAWPGHGQQLQRH
ncbi:olfactory receptor 51G2-like [Apteryx rowi]|uniref:olfactory receptor 51G2-like n=1 Tax=Apteryx rowi TaxID=308060 RepID=UPI000E1D6B6C|nr:olfactory receptor 51G2-like [Apteryx rowi]XP_025914366.1 olfactory receptor 51G2-like [Apteryx rowi]XP_025914367.1 olfactory receptor 51G2-like [Apteryx rowi]XP_025914368.1 olfactory receptor 51G2-like [Apteryx rowi]XP_025914369.1 olfactory receptor 51G2-like [Apteryx rowi]XP_025914370.1 olfactory receptor 51G2-like [Apteryx rowi]XP_025914371.1 olfactory receptor 51G2-like [Apteryx rowi]